jgi:hypothetical protein
MPFLFVDYDQGAGGESFCTRLSTAPQCETLTATVYNNNRTKVRDLFAQEFLKLTPQIEVKESHPTLYTVVPCHRHTDLAYAKLKDVYSIRIAMPTDPKMLAQLKENKIQKVYLTQEPPEYFVGLVRILKETAVDPDFVKKIKYNTMQTVEIYLLAQGKEPTQQNIDEFLNELRNGINPEPKLSYDLVLQYETLQYDPDQTKQLIKNKFGIEYD